MTATWKEAGPGRNSTARSDFSGDYSGQREGVAFYVRYGFMSVRRSLSPRISSAISMPHMVRNMDAWRRTFKRLVEFAIIFLARAHGTGHFHGAAFLRGFKKGVAHGAIMIAYRDGHSVTLIVLIIGAVIRVTV
jgi:hypothetical protein